MHKKTISKYYFINKFDTNNIDRQDKQTIIIYRNYINKKNNELLVLKFKKYCKKKGKKFFLANNIKLAIKLNLDGVYIPSFNKSLSHLNYSYNKNFKIIGSAHNLKEIRIKEKQGVQQIFLSPLFKTKKTNRSLGVIKFNYLAMQTQKQIIALGGINKKNINKINVIRSYGFASISYINEI